MNIANKLTYRHLKENKGRTVVTTLGICVSVAMITAVFVAMASFLNLFGEIGKISSGNWDAYYYHLSQSQIEQVEKDSRISKVGLKYGGENKSFQIIRPLIKEARLKLLSGINHILKWYLRATLTVKYRLMKMKLR